MTTPAPQNHSGTTPSAERTSIRRIVWRLLRYARPYLLLIGVAVVCAGLYAGTRYGRAYLMKPLIDDVVLPAQIFAGGAEAGAGAPSTPVQIPLVEIPPPSAASKTPAAAGEIPPEVWESFYFVVTVGLVILFVAPLSMFVRLYASRYVLARISIDIRRELTSKLLRLPLSFHRNARSGDTVTRLLSDVNMSRRAFELLFVDLLLAVIMGIVGATTLFVISWQLALVSLIAAPLVVGVLSYFAKRIRRTAARRQEQLGEVTGRILAILAGIKVIKIFRGEELENRAFERETGKYFRRQMKVEKNRVLSRSLAEFLNNGMAIGVLMLGVVLLLRGRWDLSSGDLVAFGAVLASTYRPLKQLSNGWTLLMESISSAERFFAILDLEEEVSNPSGALRIDGVHRSIRFEHVSFSYDRGPVLRDVSLEIAAGEVIAIVGRTGSGKTTLVDLLLRFQEPDSGSIEIDGVDLRRISRDSLLDHAAMVTHEPFLFEATIGENIRYGRPDASDAEMLAAARAAHVDEFVDHLPMGYQTEVGEFGLRLSGGQRQRITIARAILKDPAILIFDEATSALDAKTERTVQDAIEALRGKRTVIVIAHRLSTIRRADRIVMLEHGTVSQVGSHEELLRKGGLYAELDALSGDVIAPDE